MDKFTPTLKEFLAPEKNLENWRHFGSKDRRSLSSEITHHREKYGCMADLFILFGFSCFLCVFSIDI